MTIAGAAIHIGAGPTWRVPPQDAPIIREVRAVVETHLEGVAGDGTRRFCVVDVLAWPRVTSWGAVVPVGAACEEYSRDGKFLVDANLSWGEPAVFLLARTGDRYSVQGSFAFEAEGGPIPTAMALLPAGLREAWLHGRIVGRPDQPTTLTRAWRFFGCDGHPPDSPRDRMRCVRRMDTES